MYREKRSPNTLKNKRKVTTKGEKRKRIKKEVQQCVTRI